MPLLTQGWEVGDFTYYQAYSGWDLVGGTLTTVNSHKDASGFGGRYTMFSNASGISTQLIPGTPRWAHCWMFTDNTTAFYGVPFQFRTAYDNRDHVSISVRASGAVEIRRGSETGSLLATSATNLDTSRGHWYAMEVVVANSGGIVNVYVDDDPTVFVSYTGDTQAGGSAYWDEFAFSASAVSSGYLDDIIITDLAEGQVAETFGQGLRTASDASTALTPSTGSDNWMNVHNSDTSRYNAGLSGPLVDLYGVAGNGVLGATVLCVSVQGFAAFQNSFTMQTKLKSGTTTVSGLSVTGTADYNPFPQTFHVTDPDTAAAWTAAGVLALQVGVQSGT